MTRQEAFEQSRQDWKDEEERRDHDHCYAFYTDSCKWFATIEEAQELVKMLNEKLKRLNKSLKTDAQVLSHYAQPDAMGRWGMATIDLKRAQTRRHNDRKTQGARGSAPRIGPQTDWAPCQAVANGLFDGRHRNATGSAIRAHKRDQNGVYSRRYRRGVGQARRRQ